MSGSTKTQPQPRPIPVSGPDLTSVNKNNNNNKRYSLYQPGLTPSTLQTCPRHGVQLRLTHGPPRPARRAHNKLGKSSGVLPTIRVKCLLPPLCASLTDQIPVGRRLDPEGGIPTRSDGGPCRRRPYVSAQGREGGSGVSRTVRSASCPLRHHRSNGPVDRLSFFPVGLGLPWVCIGNVTGISPLLETS